MAQGSRLLTLLRLLTLFTDFWPYARDEAKVLEQPQQGHQGQQVRGSSWASIEPLFAPAAPAFAHGA